MATDPQYWVKQFMQNSANMRAQGEGDAQQALMALFQEEASRQRPYVTMPQRLAEAEYDRRNAEPYNERAAQRRYRYSKAGQEGEDTGGGGATVDEDGNEVVIVGGKSYVVPK